MEENENPNRIVTDAGRETGNNPPIPGDEEVETRQIWQTTLRDLQAQLGRADYESWIKNLSLLELRNGMALMSAPSSFAKRRLESDYVDVIQQALTRVVGERLKVHFSVDQPVQSQLFDDVPPNYSASYKGYSQLDNQNVPGPYKRNTYGQNGPSYTNGSNSSNGSNRYPAGSGSRTADAKGRGWNNPSPGNNYNPKQFTQRSEPANGSSQKEFYYDNEPGEFNSQNEVQPNYSPRANNQNGYSYDPLSRNGFGLNPRYIFDKYVEGSSNRVATAGAKRVAEMPGFSYNPLFIYGGVGLGKTHLLHAIGHKALELQPNLTVLYVSSEQFTNDLVNSIKEGRMEDFRARYRTIDILMIDDIQFIAGKITTQEEFFHTFNSLVEANKQVVISSDRPPRAMLVLEERLRSRFEGGLTCDIQLPDYEMRLAILKAKAEVQAAHVPPDVLEFIAHKIQTNIRELEGSLTRVVAFALHNRTSLTVEVASQALNDLMLNSRKKMVTPARIVEQVSQYFNIETKEMRGRSRSQDIVVPRHIAMYIIREQTESSLVEIGQELGGRDHTTVMHGIEKIEREVETNNGLRQQVNTIVQIIYSEGGGKQ